MALAHAQRLQTLAAVAVLAAVPEALVRSPDQQIAFQAMLVAQLLGVIVAAIGVAAAFSAIGLALVRVASQPLLHRAPTFVAWSFLTSARAYQPWPLRFLRVLQGHVDVARDAPSRWRPLPLLGGLLVAGGLGAAAAWCQLHGAGLVWLMGRNLAALLALHALLLAIAGVGPKGLRTALAVALPVAAVVGAGVGGRHPAVLNYVDPLFLLGGLLVFGVLGLLRPGAEVGMAARLARRGRWGLPVGAVLLGLALAARANLGVDFATVALVSAAVAATAVGLYLLLQGQPKVSVPVFVSIVGVSAGTWALIVVLSVMGGFAADLRQKMLVANAHALIEAPGRAKPFAHAAALARTLRNVPGVVGVSPQIRGDAILSSAYNVNNFVSIRGIDADLPEVERELGSTMRSGSLALMRSPTALGSDRAMLRRSATATSDLPPTPSDLPAASTASADPMLDAMRNLPPGPAEAAPPQREMLVLPSGAAKGGATKRPASLDLPAAEVPELGPELKPGEHPADLPRPPDRPTRGSFFGLADDPPSAAPEQEDVPVTPGILIGVELARSLQVELGDRLEVVTPDGDVGPTGLRPRVRSYRVAGTFETGLYEADSKVAYMTLGEAARYFNYAGEANVLELRLSRPEEPDGVLAAVRTALASHGAAELELVDWRELNRSLFSALAFERLVIFLVLGLIILVAAFAIVSALTMVILQKHDSIAMLRAMGAAAGEVRSAFVQMGGVIGVMGTTAGAILGLGTCGLIELLGIQLPEAYYVRTLPVRLQPTELLVVIAVSMGISLLATIFPARSAAKLQPLEGLRHG
ncbi:MAG: hypothetical protein HY902_14680 [Deltaproteobacteria bacterium]|nr:hypothetical protein [Deltaproteobacteria bacterium]